MVLNFPIRFCLERKSWVWTFSPNKNDSQYTVLDTVLNATNTLCYLILTRDDCYLHFTGKKTKTQRSKAMWQGHTASKRWSQDLTSERLHISICVLNHYAKFALWGVQGSWGYACIEKIASICLSFLFPPFLSFHCLPELSNIHGLPGTMHINWSCFVKVEWCSCSKQKNNFSSDLHLWPVYRVFKKIKPLHGATLSQGNFGYTCNLIKFWDLVPSLIEFPVTNCTEPFCNAK